MSKRKSKKSANAASLNLVLKTLEKYDQDDTSSMQSAFGSLLGTLGKAPSTKILPPQVQPLNYSIHNGAFKSGKQAPKASKKHLHYVEEDAGAAGQHPELAKQLPMKAVGLPLDDATGVAGSWSSCMVTAFDMSLDRFIVSWSAGKRVGSPVMHRGLLCMEKEDCEAFVQRIQRAVQRREQAEAVLRQSLYVENMPISSDTQLDSQTISNILQLTLSSSSVPTDIGTSALLEEVNADYMHTMNKLIFETNLNDIQSEFSDLKLPEVPAPPPPPQCGVIPVPAYDYNRRFLDIATDKFVNFSFAVNALLDVRRSCVDVGTQKLLLEQQPTEISFGGGARPQPKSVSLAEFHSLHAQMSHTALRFMRDSWTRLAAKRIQQHFSQAKHPHYNPAESNRPKYVEMPLRRFLHRVNYMVEDTLRVLILQNFEGYAEFVEEMAGYVVEVRGPSDIRERLLTTEHADEQESDPLYEGAHMHQPLFRVDLTISPEKHVLNQEDVDKRAAEIREWSLANIQDRSAQCPIEPLMPREGHRFEYATSPDDFKGALAGQFDVAIDRLKSLELVERLVMERIFWPSQESIACLQDCAQSAINLQEHVGAIVERAAQPLLKYLLQFDQYISLLNLDVDEYLKTIIRVQPYEGNAEGEDGEPTPFFLP
ncbi:hypothetical protein PInf_013219 [Phytophthora infestans]|nr:hypothetical protein PInf_013219 [Phytophthora infestans]